MSLLVVPNEVGRTRVFSLSMTDDDAAQLQQVWNVQRDHGVLAEIGHPLCELLGVTTLDPQYVEVFPVNDLDELGLVGYLIEGNELEPVQLEKDRRKLSAVTGWVLIVYSAALDDDGTVLKPASELTLIGTYDMPQTDWSSQSVLQSTSAKRESRSEKKTPSDAAMSGRVATAALLVLFALTALMIWIAA